MSVFLSRCLFSMLCLCVGLAWASGEPEIRGQWIQGGLLFGMTAPGNRVTVLDQAAIVSESGEFVFGLGRDTPAEVVLTVTLPDGRKQHFNYAVEQRSYPTQRIEGVEPKYVEPPPEVTQRIQEEAAQMTRVRKKVLADAHYRSGFSWPLLGPITGVYGSQRVFNGVPKRPHFGLDIAGPVGAKVVAPAPGLVTLVHPDMYYSGGTLVIDHGHGVSSTFIHLNKVLVKEGQRVATGDLIAEVGATGRVTGPHLDWRINWFEQRLDPQLLLPPQPQLP